MTADLAGAAWGVVSREELLAAGVTAKEIKSRLAKGGLYVEFRGVYRVGHRAPSTEATYLAAVKACGDGARLHGAAAAWVLGLVKDAPPPPEVTAPRKRLIEGLISHRTRGPQDSLDVTICRGIPISTVARTLVDLAASFSLDALARACHEAGVKYGTTPAQVDRVLARRPTSPGAGKLRAVMRGDAPVSLSKLEKRFLDLLRARDLPLPEANRPASGRRVDCRWPDRHLTVELDSYRFHNSRHTWEQDRRREREAYARGDQFRRYTWGDVFEDAEPMLRELRRLLSPEHPD